MNRWGSVLLGTGGGMLVGEWAGRATPAPALVAVVLGVVLLVFSGRRGDEELVGDTSDAKAGRGEGGGVEGLGDRVQGILKLAEDQAADHLNAAREEAALIVAAAEEEARRRPS